MIWLIGIAAAGALAVSAFFYGVDVGVDRQVASQAKANDLARDVKDAAALGAAEAIARLKPRNVTITNEVQREIQNNTVYHDCRATPDGMRLANEAITGQPAESAARGQLPAASATR